MFYYNTEKKTEIKHVLTIYNSIAKQEKNVIMYTYS